MLNGGGRAHKTAGDNNLMDEQEPLECPSMLNYRWCNGVPYSDAVHPLSGEGESGPGEAAEQSTEP